MPLNKETKPNQITTNVKFDKLINYNITKKKTIVVSWIESVASHVTCPLVV